jgi:hypothetical protein
MWKEAVTYCVLGALSTIPAFVLYALKFVRPHTEILVLVLK